ncbi:hypothetical protein [Tsukamurella sp. NPDC003166]|uniref:hypothetical protein n=1 Tax=Tsukamurella sp. NPDC003166 TaxID=3154444 RepID=UPI0033BB3D45
MYGNEHRTKTADDRALLRLMYKFGLAIDFESASKRSGFLTKMLTRAAHEQFPYQESIFEELARSHAWLVEGIGEIETQVINHESLAQVLDGLTLQEAIGATIVLQVGATQNKGQYNPDWLNQENFRDVLDVFPRSTIETMAQRLTTTPDQYRKDYQRAATGKQLIARYDYNPLIANPFVDMGDGIPVAPATRLILRTVTPGGLYHAGIQKYGSDFANDLGHLFEHYIGRQLKLLPGAQIEPEIAYGKGSGNKSVDWFVIFPDLVVMVEVKSRRLSAAARAGDEVLIDSLKDTFTRARSQLENTAHRLAEGHPAFSQVPTDRPILGLIVTAEPFYSAGAYLLDHDKTTIKCEGIPDVRVGVASARDIEALVSQGNDVESLLLEQMSTSRGSISTQDLGVSEGASNPILENAWQSYSWANLS